MDTLRHDWLTEGLIDYEYKKYILLAYLMDVKKRFNQSELYPFMADLVFHYRNLVKVRESKKMMYENFPQSLSRADFDKLQLTYEKIINDDEVMDQIEEILRFALPKMKETLEEGKELFEFVEEKGKFFLLKIPMRCSALILELVSVQAAQSNFHLLSLYLPRGFENFVFFHRHF